MRLLSLTSSLFAAIRTRCSKQPRMQNRRNPWLKIRRKYFVERSIPISRGF